MERKSEWFCGVKFVTIILNQSENLVFEEKFASSLEIFCSHAAITLEFFLLFCFDFLDRIFFLNGSPNAFVVHCRPSFV